MYISSQKFVNFLIGLFVGLFGASIVATIKRKHENFDTRLAELEATVIVVEDDIYNLKNEETTSDN